MTLRILLIDRHKLMREALRALLQGQKDIVVAAEADEGGEALEQEFATDLDAAIMVVNIAGRGAATKAVEQLIGRWPGLKVLVVFAYLDKQFVLDMLGAGVAGCVVKTEEGAELFRALRSTAQGHVYLSPAVSDCMVEAAPPARGRKRNCLAPRERQVLTLLAQGLHAPAIGQSLSIAPATVEVHRRNIMRKVGVRGIAELTKYAIREGMASV